MAFLARRDEQGEQLLIDHLQGVADRAARYLPALEAAARIAGLTHDLGKYCVKFQEMLDARTTGEGDDRRFDHGGAGALFIGQLELDPELKQLLQAAVMGHHGGLPDMLIGKVSPFLQRLERYDKADFRQAADNAPDALKQDIEELVPAAEAQWRAYRERLETAAGLRLSPSEQAERGLSPEDVTVRRAAFIGLTAKLLSSALIDADRRDSARMPETDPQPLSALVERLDGVVAGLDDGKERPLNTLRRNVYAACGAVADAGIVTLDAPTGSGKTLASLRWALSRGRARAVCVLPYISIIEQNAAVARAAIGDAVGESHSYLDREADETVNDGAYRLVDTYDRPVTYTTMVQFLESVYGFGTSGIRRLHNLTFCALIFDEIQALPRECVYLFDLLIEFLTELHGSTVLLSSATDPGLGKLKGKSRFAALPCVTPVVYERPPLPERAHIRLDDMRTVTDDAQTADLVRQCLTSERCVLTVVNRKDQAAAVYRALIGFYAQEETVRIFYLTTLLCPQHRRDRIAEIGRALAKAKSGGPKVAVVSTQLIEAGVDLDFDCVIRYAAGMDSLVQCAGRCNREGKRETPGTVYVVNLQGEKLENLPEIKEGKDWLIHNRFKRPYARLVEDYFRSKFELPNSLTYILQRDGSRAAAINLLSTNTYFEETYRVNTWTDRSVRLPLHLRQAFHTVSEKFQVIRQTQVSVVVPYNDIAKAHIERLGKGDLSALRGIASYTVSLYGAEGYEAAIAKVDGTKNIYIAGPAAYDEKTGLCADAQGILI